MRQRHSHYKLLSEPIESPDERRCTLPYSVEQISELLELLKQHATLEQARDFLREHNVPHSGTWADLIDRRFWEGLDSRRITPQDLVHFLRAVEEYGRQHTFLYRCSPSKAASLMAQDRIQEKLQFYGATAVLSEPRILEKPLSPTIADARWEAGNGGGNFALKFVETRYVKTLLDEQRTETELTVRYRIEATRAVNLFYLHSDGLMELRVQSQKNSTKYGEAVARLWNLAGHIFPYREFNVHSIAEAKNAFWVRRHELAEEVAFTDSTIRNNQGTTLTAATSRASRTLAEDPGAEAGMAQFWEHGECFCDETNMWFRARAEGPDRDIHVLFTRELNEFVIPAQCSRADHEYVLRRIRELNA